MRRLFLDCDGVLADFDAGARAVLGLNPRDYQARHGLGAMWAKLARAPDFYARLPLLPDARELYEAVRHLAPTILTGLPRGEWAAPQKRRWAAEHFPGVTIITCMAIDKRLHAAPGDVLIDDMRKHAHRWEAAGGVFIHHRSARDSLAALRRVWPEALAADQPAAHVAAR